MVKIDNEYVWEDKQQKASVLLTSSLFDFGTMVSKGTAMKSINVLIPRTWLLKYIAINNAETDFKKYLTHKTASYNFAPFDIQYRTLFNEVMNNQDNGKMRSLDYRKSPYGDG